MANVIKHKRGSGSDPVASDLVVGEVAIRTDVGKLFTKMDNGSVVEIAGGGSDIAINTLSSSSGTGGGSATFNGSAYRFTLSQPPSVSAQQLLVSINGVIQKPVAGTGQPSEGFSVDGTDIILGDAPATGSDFFILTFKSLGVSEPADNSVTSAKIVDGAIVNADINASAAIAGTKISPDFGSQNTTTTGIAAVGELQITSTAPKILFIDSDTDPDYELRNMNGVFRLRDSTNDIIRITQTGSITNVAGHVDVGAGLDVTGNITATGDINLLDNGTIFGGDDAVNTLILRSSSGNVNHSRIDVGVNESDNGGLHFYTAGSTVATRRMTIKGTSGNVGIGTTSPSQLLHVNGVTQATQFKLLDNAKAVYGSSADMEIYHNATNSVIQNGTGALQIITTTGDLFFRGQDAITFNTAGNNERMRIDSSGNVGIGTTSPNAPLVVRDASSPHTVFRVNSQSESTKAFIQTVQDSDLRIGSESNHPLNLYTNGNARLHIKNTGEVGIGTTSPAVPLHIAASVPAIRLADTDGNTPYSNISAGGGDLVFEADQGNEEGNTLMLFRVDDSERMRINSSGNVGIGTTSPSHKLDVDNGTAQINRGNSTGNILLLRGLNANQFTFDTDGLKFGSDTAEANALDDYEEGYWSPVAVDGKTLHLQNSGNVAARRYIKIGKLVTCFFDINFDSGNSSPNFRTRFSGLPFSKESTSEGAGGPLTISFFDGSETDMLVGHTSSSNLMEFFENGDGLYSYSESAGDRIAGCFTYVTT